MRSAPSSPRSCPTTHSSGPSTRAQPRPSTRSRGRSCSKAIGTPVWEGASSTAIGGLRRVPDACARQCGAWDFGAGGDHRGGALAISGTAPTRDVVVLDVLTHRARPTRSRALVKATAEETGTRQRSSCRKTPDGGVGPSPYFRARARRHDVRRRPPSATITAPDRGRRRSRAPSPSCAHRGARLIRRGSTTASPTGRAMIVDAAADACRVLRVASGGMGVSGAVTFPPAHHHRLA